MKSHISECPRCSGPLTTTRFDCPACATSIQGQFQGAAAPLGRLSPEQLQFLVTFVRCEGKLNRMEEELGISYPTIRNRLYEMIAILESGRTDGAPPRPVRSDAADSRAAAVEARRQLLEDLENGRVAPDEALAILRGEKKR